MVLFLLGIIFGVAATKLWEVKKVKNLQFSVIEYILGVIWLAWIAFGGVFVVISLSESETRAGSLGALIFGGVAILALVGLRVLHIKQKGNVSSVKSAGIEG
jgi:hypothetical protein